MLKNSTGITGAALALVIFLSLSTIWGCSTQKNTLPNRLYHTTNAKYNGYFNARESYREGVRRLSNAHNDNYEQILSIFRYGNEQQAASIASYMDVAYQKASTVIRRHSMNIRGVEYNTWIDASFFLIARSHFFKRDYNLAILTLEYVVRQYDSDVAYQAKAWIAKSYHRQNRYDNALQLLERLASNRANGLLSRETERLYLLVHAEHHLMQDNALAAVPFLSDAISLTRNNRERTRLTFILAQIYHHEGDFGNAQATYARVLRMNPSFDLAFQARISMAMAYDPARGGGGDIESELNRMLRDDKNRPYRDQIYFALGQFYFRQNKEAQAIDMFKRSTEVSDENRQQKGLSFKRLGEIHFDRPDYLKASVYYDSAVAFLPSHHDEYELVNERRRLLSSLASNLRVIEREDSLQRLASMPESQRLAIIDNIIAELREEEQRARLIEQQMMRAASTIAQTRLRGGVGGAQDGGWYFYNPTAMSHGRTEFFSKFGDRPLEDLWRISNKTVSGFDMAMGDEEMEDEIEEQGDVFDRNTYLRNIPTTEEAMEASNRRIATAYYNAANIFKDHLIDRQSAIASFETLVERFPQNERKIYAYYYLYILYTELQNPSRANLFKDRLVAEFPDSEFAQILGDPAYADKLLARHQRGRNLYNQAYHAFLNERFETVLAYATEADTLDLPRDLQSQFAYLVAMVAGKLGNKTEFRQQLQSIISLYEGLPVYQPASFLLASLDAPQGLTIAFAEEIVVEEEGTAETEKMQVDSSVFSYDENAVHFFVMVVQSAQVDVPQLRNFINTFNNLAFAEENLSASSIFFDDRRQLITVTNFAGKIKGMEYYKAIMAHEGLAAFGAQSLKPFVISVENYPVFYQDKQIDEYLAFFERFYLQQ